jgi:hypothetical protein
MPSKQGAQIDTILHCLQAIERIGICLNSRPWK